MSEVKCLRCWERQRTIGNALRDVERTIRGLDEDKREPLCTRRRKRLWGFVTATQNYVRAYSPLWNQEEVRGWRRNFENELEILRKILDQLVECSRKNWRGICEPEDCTMKDATGFPITKIR